MSIEIEKGVRMTARTSTRPAVRRHGHRRFFFGAGGDGEPEAGASSEATSDPIPEASPAEEVQRGAGR